MHQQKQPLWSRSMAAALAVTLGLSVAGCNSGGDTALLIAEARKYRDKGETRAAVIQLKNAIRKDADNAAARSLLGEVYLDEGDAVSAEKELRRALELGADAGHLAPLLGKALLMQGQFERLLEEISPAAEEAGRPAMLAIRANALLGLGKVEPARDMFEDAIKLNPAAPEALLGLARIALAQHRPEESAALLARALQAAPGDIDSLRFKGDLMRARDQPDAAMAAYRQILALRPANPQALIDIANLHIDSGRLDEARASIALARKAAPGALAVFHSQAMLDYREGKHAAAQDALQQILRSAPDHLPSVLLMGAVQTALGATQQATQHLQKFLAVYPRHLYASKLMASVHIRNNDPDAALELVRPLMLAHPDDVELLALAGEANLRGRHFSLAAGLFEKAAALRPSAPGLHTGAALSRLGNGENGRAVAELERAAGLDSRSPRAGILLIMSYLRANAPDKAFDAVLALEKKGNNPLVQNLKGGVYLAKRDLANARASFEGALKLDPLYLPALDNLAQLDALEKNPGAARRRYEAALDKAPRNAALMEALARLAVNQGQNAEAIGWLERASKQNPDELGVALRLADLYARTGEMQKALVLAQKLQATHPANPDTMAMLGQVSYLNQNYAAAADSYLKLAAMAPRSPIAHMRLATVQLSMKDDLAAAATLRKVLAIDPDHADGQTTLLNVLIGQKKYAEALALARSVQQRRPQAAAGFKLEGDVLAAQDKPAEALDAYERAFALQQSGALLIQIHGVLIRTGKFAQAQERMALWFKAHPADIPARLYYASAKLVEKDYRAAIEHLQAVLKADPANIVALNDLAWSYQRINDKQALAYAERAFQLAPNSPAVMDTLGWIHVENGNLGRALPLLQKASALAPDAPEIRYHFGTLLARSGDKQGARRELERALAAKDFSRRDEARALLATL
jgi:putative PEP-CTERM system TPR-repeat lipoprotein